MKLVRSWWHSTGFFSPPWIVTVLGILGSIYLSIVLNAATVLRQCEDRRAGIVRALKSDQEALDRNLRYALPSAPTSADPGTVAWIGVILDAARVSETVRLTAKVENDRTSLRQSAC